MAYADNDKKLIIVLNKKYGAGTLLNAACHITAGLSEMLPDNSLQFQDYKSDADGFHSRLSLYPFIILQAKNGNQLRTLQQNLSEDNIPNNVFTSTMIRGSSEEQIQATRTATTEELDYMAVAMFGDAAELKAHTKKFSIFSG